MNKLKGLEDLLEILDNFAGITDLYSYGQEKPLPFSKETNAAIEDLFYQDILLDEAYSRIHDFGFISKTKLNKKREDLVCNMIRQYNGDSPSNWKLRGEDIKEMNENSKIIREINNLFIQDKNAENCLRPIEIISGKMQAGLGTTFNYDDSLAVIPYLIDCYKHQNQLGVRAKCEVKSATKFFKSNLKISK